MSNEAQKEFFSRAKQEVQQKINTETKVLGELNKEKEELNTAINGYDNYYHELKHFIIESMQDFTCIEEDLPKYFKSNINEVYQNYAQIRLDAIEEAETLNKYIKHCEKQIKNNERTLKFYSSQYTDSDFYEECIPLVDLFKEKIDLYKQNIELTEQTIEKLEKIIEKLENWK